MDELQLISDSIHDLRRVSELFVRVQLSSANCQQLSNANETVSSDKLSNGSEFSPKNQAVNAWLKHCQLGWPINVGHFSDV